MADKLIVLDFGSQYNQLIARRIREMGVYSELLSNTTPIESFRNDPELKGIVFSGGPNSVYDPNSLSVDPAIYSLGVPILGICYGMQLMAHQLGGKVDAAPVLEYGKAEITLSRPSPISASTPSTQTVWMSHGDHVTLMPPGFDLDALSTNGVHAAMSDPKRRLYALQFHPEVRHSAYGNTWLSNFVFEV